MLDERGVEHYDHDHSDVRVTEWDNGGRRDVRYEEWSSGTVRLDASNVTPEQAIAATVRRGTCHDTGEERIFCCSECGFGFSDVYLSDEAYFLDDEGGEIEPWPPFCPNCGRRVVE